MKFMKFLVILGDCNKHTVQELVQQIEVSERTIRRYKVVAGDFSFKIESKRGKFGYYRMVSKPKL